MSTSPSTLTSTSGGGSRKSTPVKGQKRKLSAIKTRSQVKYGDPTQKKSRKQKKRKTDKKSKKSNQEFFEQARMCYITERIDSPKEFKGVPNLEVSDIVSDDDIEFAIQYLTKLAMTIDGEFKENTETELAKFTDEKARRQEVNSTKAKRKTKSKSKATKGSVKSAKGGKADKSSKKSKDTKPNKAKLTAGKKEKEEKKKEKETEKEETTTQKRNWSDESFSMDIDQDKSLQATIDLTEDKDEDENDNEKDEDEQSETKKSQDENKNENDKDEKNQDEKDETDSDHPSELSHNCILRKLKCKAYIFWENRSLSKPNATKYLQDDELTFDEALGFATQFVDELTNEIKLSPIQFEKVRLEIANVWPTRHAMDRLCEFIGHKSVISVGSGYAFWEFLLKLKNKTVVAIDLYAQPIYYHPVIKTSAHEAVIACQLNCLMIVWPTTNAYDYWALCVFKKHHLIIVSDKRNETNYDSFATDQDYDDLVGSDELWRRVKKEWLLIEAVPLPNLKDSAESAACMRLYVRKPTSAPAGNPFL